MKYQYQIDPVKVLFLHEEGEPAKEPKTPGKKTTGTGPGSAEGTTDTFSQEQVDALVGKARQSARNATTEKILADLGIETLDDAKSVLATAKKLDDANKTELELAQTKLTELEPLTGQVETMTTQITGYESVLETHLKSLLADLDIPDHVEALTKEMSVDKKLEYYTLNRDAFVKSPAPNLNGGAKGGRTTQTPEQEKERRLKIKNKYGI
jgi:hypothetical protein